MHELRVTDSLHSLQKLFGRNLSAREARVPRAALIRQLISNLTIQRDDDGIFSVTSKLVDDRGRWIDETHGAAAKHALSNYLKQYPVELPQDLQTAEARNLINIKKSRSQNLFEFEFGSSSAAPHFEISGIADYGFEAIERVLPRLSRIQHATLLLRTARSAHRLCARLFSAGAHVEVHLQDPSATFLTEEDRQDIFASSKKLARDWKQLATKTGSLKVYHSIACATLRAVKIDSSFVACGWITYSREQLATSLQSSSSKGTTRKRPLKDFRIEAIGSLLPFVLVETGNPWFETINKMFEGSYSKAREAAREPYEQLSVPKNAGEI